MGQILEKIDDHAYQVGAVQHHKVHWRCSRDADGVAWLTLDQKDADTNTLSTAVLQEFDDLLQEIEGDLPKALVIRSAKQNGFCAGAHLGDFKDKDASEISAMLCRGHDMLDRLENLHVPTIAVIHGHCLGGGLELALACAMRIGIKGGLEMGFPEIKLGLHPGLGGTARLTHLIDPAEAMNMMLTGKSVYDGQTKKWGLIDAFVEERHVEGAVRAAVAGTLKKNRQSPKGKALNTAAARRLAAKRMRAVSEAKAPSRHYPAPYALIDLWAAYGGDPSTMKEKEIESFARLLRSDTAQNLMRVFFLRQSMKNLARKEADIRHVHVIGAGEMGADIAAWCAMQGMRVTLSDQAVEPLGKTVRKTVALCQDQHKSSIETRKTLDRLIPDVKNTGVAKADLIIEAVPENIDIKHKVYQSIEPQMKIGAVLATNTSSIPLDKLAERLKKPERLVGLHFFNPVSKMLVVEVVSHDQVGKNTKEMALAFTEQIGKLPAPVANYPGFLVNRALMPYLLEALVMMDENIKKETIDRAAEHFGMPMGPIEVADQVGLDICLEVADRLKQMLDKPMADIPNWLRDKVEKGELGKKTGKGFYEWKDGKAQKEGMDEKPNEEITDRLILPMLNACVECFREGVIDDLDILDGTMIFATGFAPFRGGPMHYARRCGIDAIGGRLEELADAHGERFRPDEGWATLKVNQV